MQTWLVHMREPVALWRELGPASFLAMQILSLGMVVSALVHPVFVASVLYAIGNSRRPELAPAARARLDDAAEVVRDAARWALMRLAA